MRNWHRLVRITAIALTIALLAAGIYVFSRERPQDVPWTALDLAQPIGVFTGRKITALADDPAQCRALLERAGARHDIVEPFGSAGQCWVENGLKLAGGARNIMLSPDSPSISCPVAAALSVWEWEVIQPSAQRIFGQRVDSIDHLGSYNCRKIAGSEEGSWSQHSTANAIDVAAFTLADGTKISVLSDWNEGGKKAEFLRSVRDGACDLYATVLSPDYNAAHADHFHLDQAVRGALRPRSCR